MTIPSTIATGGHANDAELVDAQNAITALLALLAGQPSGVGTATKVLHGNGTGFSAVSLTADVTGTLPIANGGTNLTAAGAAGTFLRSDGSALAAYSTPYAEYTTTAGQSTTSGAFTIVNYGTVVTDTDSAVTTGASWHFTVPTGKGGIYLVSACCMFNTSPGTNPTLYLYKGGVRQFPLSSDLVGSGAFGAGTAPSGSGLINLAAGDQIDVRAFQNAGGAVNLSTTALNNRITIKQVG